MYLLLTKDDVVVPHLFCKTCRVASLSVQVNDCLSVYHPKRGGSKLCIEFIILFCCFEITVSNFTANVVIHLYEGVMLLPTLSLRTEIDIYSTTVIYLCFAYSYNCTYDL